MSDADEEPFARLLDDVGWLRLRLAADLAVVADALDADEPDVAHDIVTADHVELERLGRDEIRWIRSVG